MKYVILLSLFALSSCIAPDSETILQDGVVIKNAKIISPVDQSITEESYIVTDGDMIVYVGSEEPNLSGSFQTIDASGKYIIPGLIDSHVHVTSTDGLTDEEELENPEIVKKFREQLPKSYLYFGYTTLVDLGTAKPKRLAEFNNFEIKPELFYVGGGAVIGNGYGLTNWEDKMPNFIYQQDEGRPIPEKYLKENHTPAAVVKRIAESGAIAVKTYYEPGFDPSQPPFPTPTKELMAEMIEETHKHNLVLAVHGNSLEAHKFLGEAKVDILAHGLWNWGEFQLDSTGTVPPEITKVLDTEIANNVKYMPTLQVIIGLKSLTDPDFLNHPELKNVLPKELIDYYKSNAEVMYANVFGDAPKEIISRVFAGISNKGKASMKYVLDNNGTILFGTDTPSSPTYGNPPGLNGYLEMTEMVKAGVPLDKILSWATIENARAFKLDSLYGTIETGKKADLVLLNKNPLEDISAYNDISKVIVKGHPMDRNSLSAVAAE